MYTTLCLILYKTLKTMVIRNYYIISLLRSISCWSSSAKFLIFCWIHNAGFGVVDKGCCGTGAIEVSILCNPASPTCTNASEYVFWDSYHPTEAAYTALIVPTLQKYVSRFYWGGNSWVNLTLKVPPSRSSSTSADPDNFYWWSVSFLQVVRRWFWLLIRTRILFVYICHSQK